MTDKMKCPFCGAELENDPNMWDAPTDFWYCPNEKCAVHDQEINVKVWQALISGKKTQDTLARSKALDVAIDALKDIQWFCYAPTMGERARYMQQCADKTLKQVNEIMKGAEK